MRLIDADDIELEEIAFYLGERYASCAPDVRDLIDGQPTVDINEEYKMLRKFATPRKPLCLCDCPNCGNSVILEDYRGCELYEAEFCPVCGQAIKWKEDD